MHTNSMYKYELECVYLYREDRSQWNVMQFIECILEIGTYMFSYMKVSERCVCLCMLRFENCKQLFSDRPWREK